MRATKGWGNAGSVREVIVAAAARQQVRIAELEALPKPPTPTDLAVLKKSLTLRDFDLDPDALFPTPEKSVDKALYGLNNCDFLREQFVRIALGT